MHFGDHTPIGLHFIAYFYLNLSAQRQKNIYPRAEFDEAHFCALFNGLAGPEVVAYPPGQRAGYLPQQNIAVLIADHRSVAFVFCRRFRVPGY